ELLGELGPALERELAGREDGERLERRLRALGHRVECAEGLDVVAEELDARRLLGGGRVHVDDPAAPRERAGLAHLAHRVVAEVEEPGRRLLPAQTIADAERAPAAAELVGRDRVLEQRAQRRDDRERTRALVKAPEREEPLVDGAARRRARLERHRPALGAREAAPLAKPAGELGAPPARSVFARRE